MAMAHESESLNRFFEGKPPIKLPKSNYILTEEDEKQMNRDIDEFISWSQTCYNCEN